MKWYWEFSHYREELGGKILDRILNRELSEQNGIKDFGQQISIQNINDHIEMTRRKKQQWIRSNPDLFKTIQIASSMDPRVLKQAQVHCW